MNQVVNAVLMPFGKDGVSIEALKTPETRTPRRKPFRNFFPRARQITADGDDLIGTLTTAATDSTTRKGIGTAVAR